MEGSLDSRLKAPVPPWDKTPGTSRDPRTVPRFRVRETFSCPRSPSTGDIVEGAIMDIVKNAIIETGRSASRAREGVWAGCHSEQ